MNNYKITYSRTTKKGREFKYRKAIVQADSKQEARFYVINSVNKYTECKKVHIVNCEEV
jgi:hypothetical protein